jgi:hypothetical protein
MKLFICQHCNTEKKTIQSVTNHERFCKVNPEAIETNISQNRLKALEKVNCKWCNSLFTKANINKHELKCLSNNEFLRTKEKTCPVCNEIFVGSGKTCSHSCSNKWFGHARIGGKYYKTDQYLIENQKYRDLCFRYHEKKCICCSEKLILAVHHLNEDPTDHRPENLVPLCPTHHQYWHSRYKYLVEDLVINYINMWKDNAPSGRSRPP